MASAAQPSVHAHTLAEDQAAASPDAPSSPAASPTLRTRASRRIAAQHAAASSSATTTTAAGSAEADTADTDTAVPADSTQTDTANTAALSRQAAAAVHLPVASSETAIVLPQTEESAAAASTQAVDLVQPSAASQADRVAAAAAAAAAAAGKHLAGPLATMPHARGGWTLDEADQQAEDVTDPYAAYAQAEEAADAAANAGQHDERSQYFHQLKAGMKVIICANHKLGRACIVKRFPELEDQEGVVQTVPTYPNTWVSVKIPHLGRVIKVRSSNFRINENGVGAFVQTERLSRSMFFNQLKEGTEVIVLDEPRKDSAHVMAAPNEGVRAIISKVPAYPSTWLVAIEKSTGRVIKARTSRIAMPSDRPPLTDVEMQEALMVARSKATGHKDKSRKKNGAANGRGNASGTDSPVAAAAAQGKKASVRRKRKLSDSSHGSPTEAATQAAILAAASAAAGFSPMDPSHMDAVGASQDAMMVPGKKGQGEEPDAKKGKRKKANSQAQSRRPQRAQQQKQHDHALQHHQQQMLMQQHHQQQAAMAAAAPPAPVPQMTPEGLSREEVFRLTYCRDHILTALIHHRLSWPFIAPIAPQFLEMSETARQLQMAYNENTLLNFNIFYQRLTTGYYHDSADFIRELRRLFGQCYARFAADQMFVDLVIELEIVLDDYLSRMPKTIALALEEAENQARAAALQSEINRRGATAAHGEMTEAQRREKQRLQEEMEAAQNLTSMAAHSG